MGNDSCNPCIIDNLATGIRGFLLDSVCAAPSTQIIWANPQGSESLREREREQQLQEAIITGHGPNTFSESTSDSAKRQLSQTPP